MVRASFEDGFRVSLRREVAKRYGIAYIVGMGGGVRLISAPKTSAAIAAQGRQPMPPHARATACERAAAMKFREACIGTHSIVSRIADTTTECACRGCRRTQRAGRAAVGRRGPPP